MNRVVVVHGAADPMLTYTLDLVGLEIIQEVDDVTVWAPRRRVEPAGFEVPYPTPDYPMP